MSLYMEHKINPNCKCLQNYVILSLYDYHHKNLRVGAKLTTGRVTYKLCSISKTKHSCMSHSIIIILYPLGRCTLILEIKELDSNGIIFIEVIIYNDDARIQGKKTFNITGPSGKFCMHSQKYSWSEAESPIPN